MRMKNFISLIGLFAVIGATVNDYAHGVAMTPQIQRLLKQKQDKIAELEKCEGKKKGFMIAGISTLGLTAGGIALNVVQANKSNRLSSEIDAARQDLSAKQGELANVQGLIAQRDRERRRAECEAQDGKRWTDDGRCVDNVVQAQVETGGNDGVAQSLYAGYELGCDHVEFRFFEHTDYEATKARLDAECRKWTGRDMVSPLGISVNSQMVYRCVGYEEKARCDYNGGVVMLGGLIGQPCAEHIKDIANSNFTGIWTRDEKGKHACKESENSTLPVPCICKPKEESNVVPPVTPLPAPKPTSDRVLGKDCLKGDLPHNATKGIYWEKPGNYQCLSEDKLVPCSCKVTDCASGFEVQNFEKCVAGSIDPLKPIQPTPVEPGKPEYNDIDAKTCKLSGGDWQYKSGSKRYECFCGINQSASDKNMVQTAGFKTCACKKNYIWVDDNDHSKGCKRGVSAAESAELNKITNLYGKFEKKVDSMDTKAGQVENAARAAGNASNATSARNYADQAKKYFGEIENLHIDAGALYDDINGLIAGLSGELKSKAQPYKQDADTLNSRMESIVSKARNAASRAEQSAVALEKSAATNKTCKTQQCQKCVDTGGKWEEQLDGTAFCRCDRKQGLVSDSSKMLYCKPANGNSSSGSKGTSGSTPVTSSNPEVQNCFNKVRTYLVRECPKCVGSLNSGHGIDAAEWDLNGMGYCEDIAAGGGYSTTIWERTDSSNTVFKVMAKNGSFRWLFCPAKCGKI